MRRRQAAIGFGLLVLDVAIAFGVGTAVRAQFLVWTVNQSDPPQCLNYFDNRVSCRWDGPTNEICLATMAVVFAALILIEFLGWRRRAR